VESNIANLCNRFLGLPFPDLGYAIGHFPLYDSIVAGAVSSDLQRAEVQQAGIEPPDEETQQAIMALLGKAELSDEEQYFLAYWRVLDNLRLLVKSALVQSQPE
jgi:hypothetical protein